MGVEVCCERQLKPELRIKLVDRDDGGNCEECVANNLNFQCFYYIPYQRIKPSHVFDVQPSVEKEYSCSG